MDAYRSVALQPADIARAVGILLNLPKALIQPKLPSDPRICKLKNNFYIHVLLNRSEGGLYIPVFFIARCIMYCSPRRDEGLITERLFSQEVNMTHVYAFIYKTHPLNCQEN